LTKGGKPRVALVDVAYLDELVRRAWFNELATQSQAAFEAYARRQGRQPDEMDEATAEALLMANE
jgi:hypothetical protein